MGSWIGKSIKYYLKCILDVIYGVGQECVLCSDYAEGLLCNSCMRKIKRFPIEGKIEKYGSDLQYYSCAYYSSAVKELIIRLKYKSDFNCGMVLVDLMKNLVEEKFANISFAAYVPSEYSTVKKRGYNQSKFLCEALCETTGKVMLNCLIKAKSTKDQIGLSGEARWSNLEGAFKVKDNSMVRGKTIILVDDVLTTGATAFYCKKAMIEAGCKEVIILTAAKSTV